MIETASIWWTNLLVIYKEEGVLGEVVSDKLSEWFSRDGQGRLSQPGIIRKEELQFQALLGDKIMLCCI